MSYQQNHSISTPPAIDFQDKATKEKFDQWMIKSNLLQIRFVSALTGLLYIIAALINSLMVSNDTIDSII